MRTPKTAAVAACLAISTPLAFADLTVGDPLLGGDFPDIQSAVDAALEGEDILILPGSYVPPTIDGKSVRLFASGNGTVLLQDPSNPEGAALTVRNLGAGQFFLATGLDVARQASPPSLLVEGPAVRIEDCQGLVHLQDCTGVVSDLFPEEGGIGPGLAVDRSAKVVLVDCLFEGSSRVVQGFSSTQEPAGVRCSDATLIAVRTRMTGHEALDLGESFLAAKSGSGLLVTDDSDARLHDCVLVGGNSDLNPGSILGVVDGSPALTADSSTVLVTGVESILEGGSGLPSGPFFSIDGEPCVSLDGGAVATISSGVTFQPGIDSNGTPADEVEVVAGADPGTQVVLEPFQRPGLSATPSSGDPGSSLALALQGEPGAAELVFFSAGFSGAQLLPLSPDPVYLDLGSGMILGALGLDAQGLGTLPLQVPANPSLAGFVAWFQCFETGSGRLSLPAAFAVVP